MRRTAAILFLLAVLSPLRARAQEPAAAWPPVEKARFFFGFSAFRASPGGELDGKLILGDSLYAFYLPRLDPSAGFSVEGGGVIKLGIWSVAYLQSSHTAYFQSWERTATLHAVELEGKGFLIRGRPVRPYLLAGFSIPWLTVRDGALRGTEVHDAQYFGLGVKVGAGLAAQLAPRIILTAGVHYRYLALLYVKGGGKARDVANTYVDRFGPKRRGFIKVPSPGWEIGLIFML